MVSWKEVMYACISRNPILWDVCLNSYLKEFLILEVYINNKGGYDVSLYWLPSQTSDEFESFITNLEKIAIDISRSNPRFVLIIGDFNVKPGN